MVDQLSDLLTSERAAALLGYVVGAVIGVMAAEGMSFDQWVWAGIAVLAVVQLRLLARPETTAAAEEA